MLCTRMFPLHSLRLTLCHPVSSSALLRTAPSSSQIGANVRHRDAQRETGRKFPRISTYAHCAANSFRMSIYEITSRNPCGMSTYEKTTRGEGQDYVTHERHKQERGARRTGTPEPKARAAKLPPLGGRFGAFPGSANLQIGGFFRGIPASAVTGRPDQQDRR